MENPRRYIDRRSFLKLAATTAAVPLLYACAPAAPPSPTAAPVLSTPVKPPAAVPQVPAIGTTAAATPAPAAGAAPTPVPTTSGIKRGGTFTMALTMSTQQFNPMQLAVGHYCWQRALFNTLTHYDTHLNPQPELAEKWDFSTDGKTMTLKLRQGVKFHTGREFTSEDVKYTHAFAIKDDTVTMRGMYQA
ncbi:MAG: ABC transporter substrate-binding protein, partial [Chloroflexota bacterium]